MDSKWTAGSDILLAAFLNGVTARPGALRCDIRNAVEKNVLPFTSQARPFSRVPRTVSGASAGPVTEAGASIPVSPRAAESRKLLA